MMCELKVKTEGSQFNSGKVRLIASDCSALTAATNTRSTFNFSIFTLDQ